MKNYSTVLIFSNNFYAFLVIWEIGSVYNGGMTKSFKSSSKGIWHHQI